MKIKKNYVIQKIADEYIVVPISEEADRVHGVIRLNETGAFLWSILENKKVSKEDLENAVMDKYNVDRHIAHRDIDYFLNKINDIGCLER